jgi:hypothetical protein
VQFSNRPINACDKRYRYFHREHFAGEGENIIMQVFKLVVSAL